jgi:TolA-binding protein
MRLCREKMCASRFSRLGSMGRLSAFLLALALGSVSAVALSACGSNNADLLPGTTASQINSNLDQVRQLVAEGDCVGAEDAVAAVSSEVEELQEVDLKLKAALEEGSTRLSEVVSRCEETEAEEAEPSLESDVEAEELEENEKKPKKEAPEKEGKEKETEPPAHEGPTLPPQSNGKGEEKGGGEGPATEEPAEETAPSGGVGPAVGVK